MMMMMGKAPIMGSSATTPSTPIISKEELTLHGK